MEISRVWLVNCVLLCLDLDTPERNLSIASNLSHTHTHIYMSSFTSNYPEKKNLQVLIIAISILHSIVVTTNYCCFITADDYVNNRCCFRSYTFIFFYF